MEIGQQISEFSLPDQNNETVSLSQFEKKWIVLYFYPKDDTSGCTKEAITFSELKNEFENRNAVIIGISPDKPESHNKFIKKYNLGINLLCDVDKKIMKQYGAWGLKKNYGKEYEGVIRSTFLINPTGQIVYKWNNVIVEVKKKDSVVRHSDIVLKKLDEFLKL